MLVVTCKERETVRIGDDIVVTIVRSQDGRTKVGIDAPKIIPVHRGAVYERIQAENRKDDRNDRTNPNKAA